MVSPPAKTAVVCDSTSYLPPELISELGIERISLYVSLGGEQRPETEIDEYASFFTRLRESEEGATTSQPSVGDFISRFEPLISAGRDIVSIHLSAGISGTFESATQARQSMIDDGIEPSRIKIYDSRSACGGMGMAIIGAAREAAAGGDAEQVLGAAERVREELDMWFAIDTLEYLRKGGRIGAARAWLGAALQVKPILTLAEEITPVERVRTRRRVFERLLEYARQLHGAGKDAWVVQHIQDPDNAQRLVAEGREIFGSDPLFVSEIGPVIGAHTGPGLLGIGGVPSTLLR